MELSSSQRPRGAAFILHSLAPTATTIICYVLLGLVIIGTHMLAITIAGGTTLSAYIDQSALQIYSHFVIGPIINTLNNSLFGSIITVGLWAVVGLAICVTVAALTGKLNEWRNAERDITIPSYGVVVHHPLRRTLIIRSLWQIFVAILIVFVTALILPVVRFCVESDARSLQQHSVLEALYVSTITLVLWMGIFHAYVILFRAYLLRTRVFGEILR